MIHPPIELIILGCGPSGGVPVAGYAEPFWGACDPYHPFNHRTRSSIYLKTNGKGLLVDTTPDLRQHLLKHGLIELEEIIITHDHADHLHGIDELRSVYFARGRQAIPMMADALTLFSLQQRFAYLFKVTSTLSLGEMGPLYPQVLEGKVLPASWEWNGLSCKSFPQDHGHSVSYGLRFGPIAYSTDFLELDDQALGCLNDLEVWIVDCIGRTPKPSHCHLEKTLGWIDKVKPKKALLTHMNHELDYETLLKELPSHVRPAYDGLTLRLEGGRLTCPLF